MSDLDRKFKKPSVDEGGQLLNLIEGDINNGSPDGKLVIDGATYKFVSIRFPSQGMKRVEIVLEFEEQAGSLIRPYSRFLTFNYADLPSGAKIKVKDFYNWVTDSVVKVLPELLDGIEQQ